MNAGPPGMQLQQRPQPGGQPGSGFQNLPNARVGPNTPSSKRPQDARQQMPGQKK